MGTNEYWPPLLYRSSFYSTVVPNLLRPVAPIHWKIEAHQTEDQDVFYTGTLSRSARQCIILLHGLEGSLNSRYMLGMAHGFSHAGFDVIALNHRGCGGYDNLQPYSYHSGFTRDLRQLVTHLKNNYQDIWLIGFSLGGNIALKYALTEDSSTDVSGIVAVSAPIDLKGSSKTLSQPMNLLYERRFLRSLKQKALLKKQQHPESTFDLDAVRSADNLGAFDDAYTAPVNGFRDANDYYDQCSTYQQIQSIKLPTLLLNAQNDSFLNLGCYPKSANNLHVLKPRFGGHVGFPQDLRMKKQFWHEVKAIEFIKTFTP